MFIFTVKWIVLLLNFARILMAGSVVTTWLLGHVVTKGQCVFPGL